jgi:hypothetical protein
MKTPSERIVAAQVLLASALAELNLAARQLAGREPLTVDVTNALRCITDAGQTIDTAYTTCVAVRRLLNDVLLTARHA